LCWSRYGLVSLASRFVMTSTSRRAEPWRVCRNL
jgi:hypothetical protein